MYIGQESNAQTMTPTENHDLIAKSTQFNSRHIVVGTPTVATCSCKKSIVALCLINITRLQLRERRCTGNEYLAGNVVQLIATQDCQLVLARPVALSCKVTRTRAGAVTRMRLSCCRPHRRNISLELLRCSNAIASTSGMQRPEFDQVLATSRLQGFLLSLCCGLVSVHGRAHGLLLLLL